MSGSKGGGIPTRWIVLGFLGVLVILGIYVVYAKGHEMSGGLFGFWDDLFGGGGQTGGKTEFEAAIECAYYRCKENCPYAITKAGAVGDFNCLDYCKEEWTDDNRRICDGHPIEIQLSSGETIEASWWRQITGGSNNALSRSDCIVDRIYRYSNLNLIFPIDSSECNIESAGVDGIIYSSCKLTSDGTFYIWSEKHYWPNECTVGATCIATIICDRQP